MKSQNKTKSSLLLAMLMLSTMLIAVPAYADDTGLKSPTAYATGTTGDPPSYPERALLDDVTTGTINDDNCALFKTENRPAYIADSEIYYNFSFGLPAGATIEGIEVVVSGYRTGPGSLTNLVFSVRLWENTGGVWTTSKSTTALTDVDAVYTLGGSGDLWGETTWTDDSLSDANFKLEIRPAGPSSTGEHWKLDSVSVKVYYTVAGFEVGDYFTYTQGGWGSPPQGGNPGQILLSNFATVYPSGVEVGIPGATGYSMLFTSAANVTAYLPAGGTAGALTGDLTNPTTSISGVFGGQVLALQINVDFSAAGITQGPGGPVGELELCNTGTSLDGQTIAQILAAANTALGGGALPTGYDISGLNALVDNLNKAFDNGIPSLWAIDHLCK